MCKIKEKLNLCLSLVVEERCRVVVRELGEKKGSSPDQGDSLEVLMTDKTLLYSYFLGPIVRVVVTTLPGVTWSGTDTVKRRSNDTGMRRVGPALEVETY